MAARYEGDRSSARLAFWATAGAIYVLWNLGTLIGALGAGLIEDPNAFGLDAAAPAAFLALVWPRLTSWAMRAVAIVSLVLAVALSPFLGAGLPVLVAGAGGIVVGLALGARARES
jgi:predicted branched-subunit amino acid permease